MTRMGLRAGLWALLGLLGLGCDISAECLPWFKGAQCLDTDLGRECTSKDPELLRRVTIKANSNDVVSDPGFENCESFYCTSTNASRPYCTRRCDSDFDCNPGGIPCAEQLPKGVPCRRREDWACEVVIEFGALACGSVDPNTGSCDLDDATGKVINPVKYCRAKDGTIPLGTLTDLNATGTDGGM